jgi:GxxExxY protein
LLARQSFEFDGLHFDEGLRVDLLVNGCLVVELKSVEKLSAVHLKQLLTYPRLMKLPVGLLVNFGAASFKEGIRRVVNRHRDFAASRRPESY